MTMSTVPRFTRPHIMKRRPMTNKWVTRDELMITEINIAIKVKKTVTNIIKQGISASAKHSSNKSSKTKWYCGDTWPVERWQIFDTREEFKWLNPRYQTKCNQWFQESFRLRVYTGCPQPWVQRRSWWLALVLVSHFSSVRPEILVGNMIMKPNCNPNCKIIRNMITPIQRNTNHRDSDHLHDGLNWLLSKGFLIMSTNSRKWLSLKLVLGIIIKAYFSSSQFP